MSSTEGDRIRDYMNNCRKSTILLFALKGTSLGIKSFEMTSFTEKYFEIMVRTTSSDKKIPIAVHFNPPLNSFNEAQKRLVYMHENDFFYSLPSVLPGMLSLLLWLPLPLCSQAVQFDMPLFIQPYLPSTHVALIAVGCILFIHFLESLLVMSMLLRVRVSAATIFAWVMLTLVFGYLQTDKALRLHKVHSKGPPPKLKK